MFRSTLVRFHPVREFALAVGSYEGGITMVDTQTNQKLFSNEMAHRAPIRDISMFDSADVFVSCGYDSKINVYDLRRNAVVQQHRQDHPLSSVCVSSCGKLCVAGNLKGDVIAFDFRSMKEPLNIKRVYDSAVIRVAFIPSRTSNSNTIHDSFVSANSDLVNSLYKSVSSASSASISRQSSGLESFDTCPRTSIVDDVTPTRRDTWSDFMAIQKPHDFSLDSVADTPSLMSHAGDFQSRFSLGQSMSNDNIEQKSRAESVIPEIQSTKPNDKKEKNTIESKRRRMTEIVALEGIEEEDASEMNKTDQFTTNTNSTHKKWLNTVNHKEFADRFAAYTKKVFNENVTAPSKINESPNQDSEEGNQTFLPLFPVTESLRFFFHYRQRKSSK